MRPILVLDDDKYRHKVLKSSLLHTEAYTVSEAIEFLEADPYDIVFLDHDLDGHAFVDSFGEESTGYTLAMWIVLNKPKIPLIVLHSLNPSGVENMYNLLAGAGYTVYCAPFWALARDGELEKIFVLIEALCPTTTSTTEDATPPT